MFLGTFQFNVALEPLKMKIKKESNKTTAQHQQERWHGALGPAINQVVMAVHRVLALSQVI